MRKLFPVVISAALIASVAPGEASAKGCIRGMIAGGVAGHYAGHHDGRLCGRPLLLQAQGRQGCRCGTGQARRRALID
jgi:hypothetical protein